MLRDKDSTNLSFRVANHSVAAIIPAHNEGRNILTVLEVLHQSNTLDEIIVVNDGSTDNTECLANQMAQIDPRIRIIGLNSNKGKGEAVLSGWHSTQASILLLLDADLINLNVHHIQSLIHPVLEGHVDMTVGSFRGGKIPTDLAHIATPWLSGQRCLKAELLKSISIKAAAGYGLETAISVTAMQNQWHCCKVILRGVTHPQSESHRGFYKGFMNRVKMYTEILRAYWIAQHEGPTKHSTSFRSHSEYKKI